MGVHHDNNASLLKITTGLFLWSVWSSKSRITEIFSPNFRYSFVYEAWTSFIAGSNKVNPIIPTSNYRSLNNVT